MTVSNTHLAHLQRQDAIVAGNRRTRAEALAKAIDYFKDREPESGSKSVVEVAGRFLAFMNDEPYTEKKIKKGKK